MENRPGPSPETNASDDGDKPQTRSKTRRLPLASLLETSNVSNKNSLERPPRHRVDRVLTELIVRRKLQEGRRSTRERNEPETPETPPTSDDPSVAAHEAALPEPIAPEITAPRPEVEQPEEADESRPEDQASEDGYELLPNLRLGAEDFVGDIVVHLRDPIEERLVREAVGAESTPESIPEAADESDLDEGSEGSLALVSSETEITPSPIANGGTEAPAPQGSEVPTMPTVGSPERLADASVSAPLLYGPEADAIYDAHVAPAPLEAAAHSAVEGENGVSKEEIDDIIHHATKTGQNRGVVTGLVVGAAYEHYKHKGREKRAEKDRQVKARQAKKTEQANKIHAEKQQQQTNELERRQQATEGTLSDTAARLKKYEQQSRVEKQPITTPEQVQKEELQPSPEYRTQTSAWHSIQISAETGRPVENPTFTYGEEYHKERAQESQHAAVAPQEQGAATRPAAPQQHAGGGSSGDSSSLPSLGLPSASTQGPPLATKQAAKTALRPKTATGQPAGPIWPWLVALAAVVICLAVVLH